MSEYQYYEFQAVDRPLDEADREALRELSSRARITATSFTNSYEWGNFKGDPAELIDRWFDLHLYLANWGTHRLMIRLPKRLADRWNLDELLSAVDCADLRVSGENIILDIEREEMDCGDEDWDDGSGWLASLAPLRTDVLQGDLRIFYLLWLIAVEEDTFEPDEPEPMPWIGPVSGALEAFSRFFGIDPDMVAAAAERSVNATANTTSSDDARGAIAAMTDHDKTEMLLRLFDGDPAAAHDLRAIIQDRQALDTDAPPAAARTIGELRARAVAIRVARKRAAAEKAEADRLRQAEAAEKARQARLDILERQGDRIWQEVENEIERRNASGYDRAASLLSDLHALAGKRGTMPDFANRLRTIRERHVRKEVFLKRLVSLG